MVRLFTFLSLLLLPSTALSAFRHAHTTSLLPARSGRLLLMSVSLAGFSAVSFQNPFTELASLLVGNGDIRSVLGLLVFLIVSLVLGQLSLSHLFLIP